jgi:hypothetical protein
VTFREKHAFQIKIVLLLCEHQTNNIIDIC